MHDRACRDLLAVVHTCDIIAVWLNLSRFVRDVNASFRSHAFIKRLIALSDSLPAAKTAIASQNRNTEQNIAPHPKANRLAVKRFTPHHPPVEDHVIPLFHGGRDDLSNLVLACSNCNSAKSAQRLTLV